MPPTPHTLIRSALLADGLGGEARPGQEVLVRDGRIAALGARLDFPPETQIIDLGQACLTPGLTGGTATASVAVVEIERQFGLDHCI